MGVCACVCARGPYQTVLVAVFQMGLWVDTVEPSEHPLCSPNTAPWLRVSARPGHPTHRHTTPTQLRQGEKKNGWKRWRRHRCGSVWNRRYRWRPIRLSDVADTHTPWAHAVISWSLLPPPPLSKLPAGGSRRTAACGALPAVKLMHTGRGSLSLAACSCRQKQPFGHQPTQLAC